MKNNNIRYEIRIIGVTKQYNLVFPIKFKNMMHKEFESSVQLVDKASNKILKEEKL